MTYILGNNLDGHKISESWDSGGCRSQTDSSGFAALHHLLSLKDLLMGVPDSHQGSSHHHQQSDAAADIGTMIIRHDLKSTFVLIKQIECKMTVEVDPIVSA